MFRCLFFFKQKTAYEMRISDWSSDVCSSDLRAGCRATRAAQPAAGRERTQLSPHQPLYRTGIDRCAALPSRATGDRQRCGAVRRIGIADARRLRQGTELDDRRTAAADAVRSEEHTSELQSLMRISYAVFCLKKKNNIDNRKQQNIYCTNE